MGLHIGAIDEATIGWIDILVSVAVEGRLAEVGHQGRVGQESGGQLQLGQLLPQLLLLLVVQVSLLCFHDASALLSHLALGI